MPSVDELLHSASEVSEVQGGASLGVQQVQGNTSGRRERRKTEGYNVFLHVFPFVLRVNPGDHL